MRVRRLGCALPAIAVLALVLGLPLLTVFILMGLSGDEAAGSTSGYNDVLAKNKVPGPYREWLVKAADQCKQVTAPLLAAQLDAESSFNTNAVSPVGAQGPAQFMPDTWRKWGQDDDGNGTADPTDIGDAVMAQGRYMCHLAKDTHEHSGDTTSLMLAAYNAGPQAVVQYDGVPPYSETRGYVKRIKKLTDKYTGTNTGKIAFPVDGTNWRDQDNFGTRGGKWASMHTGTDFSAACGTPVLAATDGTVHISHPSWAGRTLVKISTRGKGSLTTWYAHMQTTHVTDGDKVKAGEHIGDTGAEGNATGCHLHFEVHPTGGSIYQDPTNPVKWLKKHGAYGN